MLTENALVVRSRGDRAIVKTFRGEACGHCAAAGACKVLGGGKEMRIEVLNYIRAKEGDKVELTLPEASLVKASAVTYLIPLVSLIGGAILGQNLAPSLGWSADISAMTMSATALALSFIPVTWLNRRLSGVDNYIPRITRVLPPEIASEPLPVSESGSCPV